MMNVHARNEAVGDYVIIYSRFGEHNVAHRLATITGETEDHWTVEGKKIPKNSRTTPDSGLIIHTDFVEKRLEKRRDQIRTVNANLRKRLIGRVVLTLGVSEGPKKAILEAVSKFDSFEPENDPRGLNDFGKVEVCGVPYFFKIDFYDLDLEYGADPITDDYRPVLTIMRADEY